MLYGANMLVLLHHANRPAFMRVQFPIILGPKRFEAFPGNMPHKLHHHLCLAFFKVDGECMCCEDISDHVQQRGSVG